MFNKSIYLHRFSNTKEIIKYDLLFIFDTHPDKNLRSGYLDSFFINVMYKIMLHIYKDKS